MARQEHHYDVIVAGGGLSGTMAAVAAAREGCRTLLVERYAALGGMATLGLVQPITMWGLENRYVIGGTAKSLFEKVISETPDAATPLSQYGPTFDTEHLKKLLEDTALNSGVEILYHTWISGVLINGNSLERIETVSKSGRGALSGRLFIDATGDADIASFANVPFQEGSQGVTLMFILAGLDFNRIPDNDRLQDIWNRHKVGYRALAIFRHPGRNAVYANVTEVENVNGLDPQDLTRATIECRRQAWKILAVLKKHLPGFENAYIEQTAPALGVRESRRIQGRYILSEEDVMAGRDFPDTIARACSPVDIHGPHNNGRGEYKPLQQGYGIPYRSLITNILRNLIVTGRPISADRAAHSSLRRMAPCSALGEAAGVAATLALEEGDVRSIPIAVLRDKLESYGAIL